MGVGGASKSGGAGGPGGAGGGGDAGGMPTFTMPGLDRELKPGDVITMDEARTIVAGSGGKLRIENGVIVGKNPDGSGDVYIEIGKPLDEGQIHDLHHTVDNSGGNGNGM
jgi:Xaa-Pro aminopeptidase